MIDMAAEYLVHKLPKKLDPRKDTDLLNLKDEILGELNKVKYPHVWELARQILSIPSTSAPSERLFSASHLISNKRASLPHKNADMLLFSKANIDLILR